MSEAKKKNARELSHREVIERLQRIAAGGAVKAIDAALILNVSLRTVRRYIAMGILRCVKVTQRTVYLDRSQIEGLLRLPLPFDDVDQKFLEARMSR